MDERRLKFFLALQKKVESSKNLSPKAKEKFYALAEGSIGEPDVVEDSGGEGNDFAKVYREHGFVSIPLDEIEVKIEDKRKKVGLDLNKHKPIDVNSFLSSFGSEDHPFKYLVHDLTNPGEVFNLDRLLREVDNKFQVETKRYDIPKFLYSRLKAFIGLSKEDWRFKGKRYNFSFHSDKVKSWCTEHLGKHPLFGFQSEIKFFKESIRVDGNLKEVIEFALAQKGLLTTFDINYEIDKDYFYTDVDAFISGLEIIFNSIHQRVKNGTEIKVVFQRKFIPNKLGILKIIHVGSECIKELREEELLGGDLLGAKKFFYGLCDWSIIAKNPNPDINKINILYHPSTGKKPKEKTEDPIEGFTHVLTFHF